MVTKGARSGSRSGSSKSTATLEGLAVAQERTNEILRVIHATLQKRSTADASGIKPPVDTPATDATGDWRPQPGAQTEFLSRTAFEALYEGEAWGKTTALVVDAIRYVGTGHPVHAILLRSTYILMNIGLLPMTQALYPRLGGHYNHSSRVWRFPGGETVKLEYLEGRREDDHCGADYSFVGFDEISAFTERQYLLLLSRCRLEGARCRVRATSGPLDRRDPDLKWIFDRFQARHEPTIWPRL